MKDYKKEYYEQEVFWEYDYSKIPAEKERIKEIIEIIRSDVRSILDVGCGNGTFVNTLNSALPDKFDKTVGLDSSKEALKYVKTEKINGSITNLPFEDNSYDLVTCLEILEHLPQEDFKKGILELQRVSKKYIIITVPNDQDLERSLVMCPKCYCWFNPFFHMRSFKKIMMHSIFENFKSTRIKEIGPISEYRSYNRLLLTFYRAWREPLPPETAICPQCGYQYKRDETQNARNNVSNHFVLEFLLLFKPLVKMIWSSKKKKMWLLALYEKANG